MTLEMYKESDASPDKDWRIRCRKDADGDIAIEAVDRDTGDTVSLLAFIALNGSLYLADDAQREFDRNGYDASPLAFDEKGRLLVETQD